MIDPRNVPTSTDVTVPVREMNRLPVISADQYAHLGRASGAYVAAAFEMIGGLPRFADWASSNPTDFFTKIWGKTIQRSTAVEHSGTLTIDDAITRLESQSIPAEFEEIGDATYYDL